MASGWRLALGAAVLLQACGGESPPPASVRDIGEKIFFDTSLSASGRQSCGTCHVPSRAFAGDDAGPVPLGGPDLATPGFRNTPSIMYLADNPAFAFDGEGTPSGGLNRDGRADSLEAQAQRPFLAPHEMANASVADVAAKLRAAPYARDLRGQFGIDLFASDEDALDAALAAIATFEQDAAVFAPFSSRFDAYQRGEGSLSDQELRGRALFEDPAKGNCAACHPAPLFTDFTFDTLGIPRNPQIPANADPSYFDLGLCGPTRTDLADRTDLCGAFKVPTLRNVELTAPYFHNGAFATLEEVVSFYVRRDTNPSEFYPGAKFDDLPDDLKANVNTSEAPYDRADGAQPALSEDEIADVVAFLKTLTDRRP